MDIFNTDTVLEHLSCLLRLLGTVSDQYYEMENLDGWKSEVVLFISDYKELRKVLNMSCDYIYKLNQDK